MLGTAGRLALGLVFSFLIGLYGYSREWLSAGGLAGAVLLGTVILGFGGWVWAALLVAFFASSSLLSHVGKSRKASLSARLAKGSRRDFVQTLANGGLAAFLALVAGLAGKEAAFFPALGLAFYGALAAVNADTWATEVGVLSSGTPHLITTGKPVPAGTSGGVTVLGTVAALSGALFIGLAAFILIQGAAWLTLDHWLLADWVVVPAAAIGGFSGSLCDSLLGATVQATYYCPSCHVETERKIHGCGESTQLLHGWSWLDNDVVNFLASLAGALAAAAIGVLLLTQP